MSGRCRRRLGRTGSRCNRGRQSRRHGRGLSGTASRWAGGRTGGGARSGFDSVNPIRRWVSDFPTFSHGFNFVAVINDHGVLVDVVVGAVKDDTKVSPFEFHGTFSIPFPLLKGILWVARKDFESSAVLQSRGGTGLDTVGEVQSETYQIAVKEEFLGGVGGITGGVHDQVFDFQLGLIFYAHATTKFNGFQCHKIVGFRRNILKVSLNAAPKAGAIGFLHMHQGHRGCKKERSKSVEIHCCLIQRRREVVGWGLVKEIVRMVVHLIFLMASLATN